MGWIHVASGSVFRLASVRSLRRADDPSGARGARARSACRGTRSSRCGRATSAAPPVPRSDRSSATPAATSPARRPRPRTASRACGSSRRSALGDAARAGPQLVLRGLTVAGESCTTLIVRARGHEPKRGSSSALCAPLPSSVIPDQTAPHPETHRAGRTLRETRSGTDEFPATARVVTLETPLTQGEEP